MRNLLAVAVALGLLAGCSSDQDPSDSKTTAAADTALQAAAMPFVARSMTTSFASLPDRGELLSYRQDRPVKHRGAFTAYPVALSEEHAFNAIRTGEMVVKAPDGELIRLQYERFVEHPDGNWSWIGRNADGTDAVLTFGEKAVFGTLPSDTGTLRLTMSGGQSWLVSTNHADLRPPRSDRPDHLVPPKLAAGSSSDAGIRAASMRAESATAAAAGSVVDVLIGYTNGLAAQLGSDSAAVTRANNLVVATNEAYANSGVNMRARLVGVVKVNYPDNTDNGDTLELLTGYRAGDGGGPIDTDPAFDELREKRDELGADLVSLVRPFRTPENNGCGIAWLIGGGQTGIVRADEPFGYSVVSDGDDLDEGDGHGYFCRPETLAHEMGHNMGQAHNEEDSDDTGVHPYSYGYREASSGGFYTIMAYQAVEGQIAIRHFANPSVKVNGRPTGVANESDNVRSMNQTMPIIATFRDTVVPLEEAAHSDVNGDGRSDLIFRNVQTGANAIWKSADYSTQQSITSVTNLAWEIVGTGDFDGDGKADILWRNSSTGKNAIWKGGDYKTQQEVTQVGDMAWTVVGVGDFNGDGKDDILWRNMRSGANTIWRSGNSTTQQSVTTVASLSWTIVGVGDFDGDGKDDILWYTKSGGRSTYWKAGNSANQKEVTAVTDTNWRIVGVGDFNGDGKSDILWRHGRNGRNAIWKSARASTQQAVTAVNLDWDAAAVGDYDGDGRSDIFWRNSVNGKNVYWKSGSSATQQSVTAITNLAWEVQD